MTSRNQGLSSNDQGRQRRETLGTRLPQAMPLAMITMRKSIHEFSLLSYIGMGLRLAALWAAKAPLLDGRKAKLAIVISFLTSAGGIIVLLKTPPKYKNRLAKIKIKTPQKSFIEHGIMAHNP